MGEIPRAVLSEEFQRRMKGRRLKTGVFLTFSFDPGFFEQEVLPTFFDIPLSLEPPLRLAQLEEALVKQVDHLAVYYDQRALEAGATSAKLDVRRVPMAWKGGFFHPKVVLLLVESQEADDQGHREQALLVGALSANLTEQGWWRNVEAFHVEELKEGEKSKLRGDLLKLIDRTRAASPPGEEHGALEAVRWFVRHRLGERIHSTAGGVLHPRLYTGLADDSDARVGVAELLKWQGIPTGLNLEVISPFFDEAGCQPLEDLIEVFAPREVRVFLPVDDQGAALVTPAVYEAVRKVAAWGKLPVDLLRAGTLQAATDRRVHAKVYRLFRPSPKYEVVFVGSVNLTTAAHSKAGNFETAILYQKDDHAQGEVPDWWLSVERAKPPKFEPLGEADEARQGPGMALRVRYSWDTGEAAALWLGAGTSPPLSLQRGAPLFDLEPLPPGEWRPLSRPDAEVLAEGLRSTSFLTVRIEGQDDATILVQEEGMAKKPSLLLNLSLADILRCWSALTPEQKGALLEHRYQELVASSGGVLGPNSPGVPIGKLQKATIFDTFAGYFHGFSSLQRRLGEALEKGREKEAEYLLFGEKYDSLPHLLDRLEDPEQAVDAVDRYVVLLCARQVLDELEKERGDFAAAHRGDLKALRQRLDKANEVRQAFTFGEPAEREKFLEWFERWFLKRAEPLEAAEP